jgi:hypothetical protein
MMDYPNTGLLFTNNRRVNENAPHMNGEVQFEKDFLLQMIKASDGEAVVIKMDAWVKRDKNNNRMVSLKVNTYVKPIQSEQKDPWDD